MEISENGEGEVYKIHYRTYCNMIVNGADLIFSSATTNPDYHGEINSDNFLQWFNNFLLCLSAPSVYGDG